MKNIKILGILLLSLSFFMISCTIEGPEGEQGIRGEQGNPGSKGDSGIKGENGESEEFESIFKSDWQAYSFTGTDREWTAIISDKSITEDVLGKANIIVYLKDTDGTVTELNYFSDENNIRQSLSVGQIKLNSTFDASDYNFRYVVIIGGTQASIKKWKITKQWITTY